MDKKSKVLISIFIVLISLCIIFTFYKYIIVRNFDIVTTENL